MTLRNYSKDNEMQTQSDHDLLVRIDERSKAMNKNFENHLIHHARYTYLAISTALTALGSLVAHLVF